MAFRRLALEQQSETLRRRLLASSELEWFELWPPVMAARAALLEALAAVPASLAHERPGSGQGESAWSAYEVARHVLAYSRNVAEIVVATASGRMAPKDPRGTLVAGAPSTLAELRRAIVDESARIAGLHRDLPAVPNLEVTVDHPLFGPLHCKAWYAFLEIHDGDHARQVRSLATAG